jgi:UTP:GlnB (protein PII) uridylyltransferase
MGITPNINRWLASGERGISSEAIVSHLTGLNILQWQFENHPHDPADLRRCALLLDACPELRAELHRMGEVSGVWKALVSEWDELVSMMWREAAEHKGVAKRTFDRMKELGC